MGLKQYSYSEGDANWYATFLARVEKQSKGMNAISLTNFTTSTVCAIAAGSVVEIDGAIFIASAETSITGSIATGLNYIICSVTDTNANPYWSQSAGTWDTAKQGFYTAAERYVAGCVSDGTKYENKWIYEHLTKSVDSVPNHLIIPKVKIGNSTRSASGLQSVTGIGFKPSVVVFFASDAVVSNANLSWGFDDGTTHMCMELNEDGGAIHMDYAKSMAVNSGGGDDIDGYISTMNSDGFTITWALSGSGSLTFEYLVFP